MINEDNKTELIDQYLNGSLTGNLLLEFEQQLQQDPDLRLDVEAQKAVLHTIKKAGEDELSAKFKRFHTQMRTEMGEQDTFSKEAPEDESAENNHVKRMWKGRSFLAIAASFILLLAAGAILWLNRSSIFGAGEELAAARPTFRVPVMEEGEGSMGFAGEGTVTDSVVVMIIADSSYTHHYQFKDTLKIYSDIIKKGSNLQLEYNDQTNTYVLHHQTDAYKLEKGFNDIQVLENISQ